MRRVQKIVEGPEALPVSLNEAKAHMRVTGADDDTIIGIYLNSAIALCEQYLQRKLITQTWKMYLDCWPSHIKVLFGDLQSVTHVKYTNSDDEQSTLDSDSYYTDTESVPGRILLKDGETWPTDTLRITNPIEIQFETGYGDDSASVPDDIRNAVLLTTQHFYENRENVLVSQFQAGGVKKIPMTALDLMSNHRVWEWVL